MNISKMILYLVSIIIEHSLVKNYQTVFNWQDVLSIKSRCADLLHTLLSTSINFDMNGSRVSYFDYAIAIIHFISFSVNGSLISL